MLCPIAATCRALSMAWSKTPVGYTYNFETTDDPDQAPYTSFEVARSPVHKNLSFWFPIDASGTLPYSPLYNSNAAQSFTYKGILPQRTAAYLHNAVDPWKGPKYRLEAVPKVHVNRSRELSRNSQL